MGPAEQRHSHHLDLFRGAGGQKPFWILEAQVGAMTLVPTEDFQDQLGSALLPPPAPGQVRLWAYAQIAAGANMINYYPWRPADFGDENLSDGILDHAGRAREPVSTEIARTVAELRELEAHIVGTERSEVAVLFDYDSWWANRTYRFTEPFSHLELRQRMVQALYALGTPCDIIDLTQLDSYRLVVAPNLQIVTPEAANRLHEFVRAGGQVLLTFRSGLRRPDGQVVAEPLPGPLRELLGMEMDASEPLGEGAAELTGPDGSAGEGRIWCDAAVCGPAEPIAVYSSGPPAGKAWLSCNHLGGGAAWYLGTLPDCAVLGAVLQKCMRQAGVQPVAEVPDRVVVGRRCGPAGRSVFLINYSDRPARCRVTGNGEPLDVTVSPRDAVVLRTPADQESDR
jgi:beta-galactosidase